MFVDSVCIQEISCLKTEAEQSSKELFVYYTLTVEHNYIYSSVTLGLQLHVSDLYVGHLQVVAWLSEQLYKIYGVFF